MFALFAAAAGWLAGGRHVPGPRPALLASRPILMGADECKDTVCWALKNTKVSALENMSPEVRQQELELLEKQIAAIKRVSGGEAALAPTPAELPVAVSPPIAVPSTPTPPEPPIAASPLTPELPKLEIPSFGGDLPPAAFKDPMAAVADKMFVQEMEPSSLAAPTHEAVSAASDAVAAGVIPWVGIGLVFVVFPILVLVVSEVTSNGPVEPEAPAGRSTSGGQAASSSGSAPAERSMPEILSSGLANLKQEPTGWLFGKPTPLRAG